MAAFDLITKGGLDDYRHHCKSCKNTLPSLENIEQKLTNMSEQQEQRMRTLEDRVNKMETWTKQTVKEELKCAKEDFMEDIEDKISKIVDSKTREIEDRRRKEMNIVVFNLPEGTSSYNEVNRERDHSEIKYIASQVGIDDLKIESSYRLGRKPRTPSEKPRVLRVILSDKKQRKELLSVRFISDSLPPKYNKLAIYRDLTEQQRTERREKRERQPRGRIVHQPPSRPLRTVLDTTNTEVEQVQGEAENPLERSVHELSQEAGDPFQNTTLMDRSSQHMSVIAETGEEEETIIGGLLVNQTQAEATASCDVNNTLQELQQQCDY